MNYYWSTPSSLWLPWLLFQGSWWWLWFLCSPCLSWFLRGGLPCNLNFLMGLRRVTAFQLVQHFSSLRVEMPASKLLIGHNWNALPLYFFKAKSTTLRWTHLWLRHSRRTILYFLWVQWCCANDRVNLRPWIPQSGGPGGIVAVLG